MPMHTKDNWSGMSVMCEFDGFLVLTSVTFASISVVPSDNPFG